MHVSQDVLKQTDTSYCTVTGHLPHTTSASTAAELVVPGRTNSNTLSVEGRRRMKKDRARALLRRSNRIGASCSFQCFDNDCC